MQFTFKIGSKIKEAWPIYKGNFSTFLLLMVITMVVKYVGSKDNWVLMIMSYVVSLLLAFIWIRFTLGLIDKKIFNPFLREALPSLTQYWNLLKTIILYSLCVLAGVILLVIPGFYVSGRLLFVIYLSIDKNQGGVVTIKEAWNMTKGYGWKLLWKSFLIGLFMALGFVALFFGSFVTYPLGMIVMAMMYREFSKMKLQNITETTSSPLSVQ